MIICNGTNDVHVSMFGGVFHPYIYNIAFFKGAIHSISAFSLSMEKVFAIPVSSLSTNTSNCTRNIICLGFLDGSVQCFSFEAQPGITPSMENEVKLEGLWRKKMKRSVRALQISEGGTSLYATSSNRSVCLFDIETGKRVRCIREGHKSRPNVMALLPGDKRHFVTGAENGEIKTWDFGQPKPNVHTFAEQEDIINSLNVWKNNLLAASGDGTLAAYDTRKGKMRVRSETMHSELLSLAVTERFTYVGAADGHIEVFNNGQFGNIRERMESPFPMGVEQMVVLRNNLLLATASTAEEMRFLHVNPNKTLCGIPCPGGVDILAKTTDGTLLFTTSADGTKLNGRSTEELVKDIPLLTAQGMRSFNNSQKAEERKRKRATTDAFFGDLLAANDAEMKEEEARTDEDDDEEEEEEGDESESDDEEEEDENGSESDNEDKDMG